MLTLKTWFCFDQNTEINVNVIEKNKYKPARFPIAISTDIFLYIKYIKCASLELFE